MSVELREIRESDIPILFAHQADPEGSAMAAFPSRDEPAFREHIAKIVADPALVARAIVAGDEVVGQIGSWSADGEREVGYWIGREHWGKGYATEALRALLAIDRVRPMWAHIVEHNVGSQTVVQRCGFVLDREEQEDVLMRVYRLDGGAEHM
jgi:RimJ/RimL family protein N-acetyltransferase